MNPDNIRYEPFKFPDQTIPVGKLLPDLACQAAWYYYTLAHKIYAFDKEGQFGTLEHELWLDPKYEQLAYTIATQYSLDSPDDFMKFMPIVALECERCQMSLPQAIYLKPRRLL